METNGVESNSFAFVGATAVASREHIGTTAASNAGDERRMTEIGATALFEEALLAALRAQLSELKSVAR